MAISDPENPIFDLIEGLAPPHQQVQFFGHSEQEKFMLSAWLAGKMHHAWLLTGPKGIGKATFAFRAARFIFAEGAKDSRNVMFADEAPTTMDTSAENQTSHLVSNLAHPNLLVIDRPYDEKTKKFRTEITVEEVRKTVRFFGSTAGEKTWRVCIVDPADDLNSNAANALLKILEEPPARTVFFLVSHAPGRLLPTIRSRCQQLNFAPLQKSVLSTAIPALRIAEGDTAKQLSESCEGSIRKAAELQSDEGLVLVHAFERLLTPPFNPDYESLNALGDLVSQRGKEERFENFANLVYRHLSKQLHEQSKTGKRTNTELFQLAEAWEQAREKIQETRIFNLDKKQTVIEVVRMLAKASRGA